MESFLKPRLTGARFECGAIPLEVLKDLAVLEEMIIEVAKIEYRKENPDRKRIPRRFTEGIELRLTGIEHGSAVPAISLLSNKDELFPTDGPIRFFEQAREAVIHAIRAAESNESITKFLPEKALSYFDRLGRSLRDGEAIEFSSPRDEVCSRLTRETRRRLLLASATANITEEYSIRGSIPEADQENMSFEIRLIEGRKIKAPIPPQHIDVIIEAFTGYKNGARVLLQGIGRFDRGERLLGFDSIEHISILDPMDISARLDELISLSDGWLEGGGKVPSEEGLRWLSNAIAEHYPDELQLPFLYPTDVGGIQAEWSLGSVEITIDIDTDKHTGYFHMLNFETEESESCAISLNSKDDWRWLSEKVRPISGGAE